MKITSIGELIVDFTPAGKSNGDNPLYEMNCGGACANVAAAAAKLGAEAVFAGKVGKDVFGEFLVQRLTESGVNTEYMIADDRYDTTLAFVHLNDMGDRSFHFVRNPGAETRLVFNDIPKAMLEDTDILHFGSIPLTHEPSRSTIMQIAKKAYDAGKIVSFDPNLRRPLWNDLYEAREVLLSCLRFSHILKVSEKELEFLTGISTLKKATEYLSDKYGLQMILVTLGKDGVYCKHGEETYSLPAFEKIQPIDTTGAGDCFIGAFLRCVSEYGMGAMYGETLKNVLRFANIAAGLSTAGKGTIASFPDETTVKGFLD